MKPVANLEVIVDKISYLSDEKQFDPEWQPSLWIIIPQTTQIFYKTFVNNTVSGPNCGQSIKACKVGRFVEFS